LNNNEIEFPDVERSFLYKKKEKWKGKSVNQWPHPWKETAGKLLARSTMAKENGLLQTGTVRRAGHKQRRLKI
jgi:hypothetical protein